MENKKDTLVIFGYSDGSYEYAVGEHAQEVKSWLNSAESMLCMHGGGYKGRKMISVPAEASDLESLSSIAERDFPEWIAQLRRLREGKR